MLLETAVVQLNIVDRASDNTIGRTLKTLSSLTYRNNGSSHRRPRRTKLTSVNYETEAEAQQVAERLASQRPMNGSTEC
jgi:hypothetical protein